MKKIIGFILNAMIFVVEYIIFLPFLFICERFEIDISEFLKVQEKKSMVILQVVMIFCLVAHWVTLISLLI
jgi:hypothetical protein